MLSTPESLTAPGPPNPSTIYILHYSSFLTLPRYRYRPNIDTHTYIHEHINAI